MKSVGALLLLGFTAPAFGEGGLSAGPVLQRAWGTRAAAMAEAFTAVRGDAESLGANPAGLASIRKQEYLALYQLGFAGESFGGLAYARPLEDGALAAGIAYFDGGDVTLNLSNGTVSTLKAQKDFLGTVAYATSVAPWLEIGGAAKILKSTLAESFTANTVLVDAGLVLSTPIKRLVAGASLKNVGKGLKFENEAEPLPRTVRLGLAYEWWPGFERGRSKTERLFGALSTEGSNMDTRYALRLNADAAFQRSEDARVDFGAELLRREDGGMFDAAFRLGYRIQTDATGFSLGFGLLYASGFGIDYAASIDAELPASHRVQLRFRF